MHIYIYIWARFMVLYLIHYFSGGPEKHARPYIYIMYITIYDSLSLYIYTHAYARILQQAVRFLGTCCHQEAPVKSGAGIQI